MHLGVVCRAHADVSSELCGSRQIIVRSVPLIYECQLIKNLWWAYMYLESQIKCWCVTKIYDNLSSHLVSSFPSNALSELLLRVRKKEECRDDYHSLWITCTVEWMIRVDLIVNIGKWERSVFFRRFSLSVVTEESVHIYTSVSNT